MRKSCFLVLCSLLLAGGMIPNIGTVPGELADDDDVAPLPMNGYGDYLPPLDGDWIINQDTYVGNETLIIEKNITVMGGATLTLQNVTLRMNSTTSTGDNNRIEVLSGGTLVIKDGDWNNQTINDASRIMRNNPSYGYLFTAWAGSTLRIYNSIIEGCGRISSPLHVRGGIYIETDDAIIDHSIISNGTYYGIVLYGSDAVVSNNTIEWCDTGVRTTTWSNGTIENNVIISSNSYGIYVDGWDNTVKRSSNPLIRGNKILNTGRGINTADALQVEYYSSPAIINNEIIDFTEDGIYLGERCRAILINNTFDACGGKYGIASSEPREVDVVNCTVKNTAWWDLSLAGAYFNLINTTFNETKVIFQNPGDGSNLTVRWYLHTQIIDVLGNPISGAVTRIQDNANGTYDNNYTTDSNGRVNWVVLKDYYRTSSGTISYNPYNITVSKPGYLTSYAEVKMNESKYITIALDLNDPPIADAGPDQAISEDETAFFDGSGSYDDVDILWYNWSFGDGSYDFGTNNITSHTYTTAGTYIVTLNVTNILRQWSTDTCLVFVNNVAPIANAGSDKTGNEGQAISFDGSASWDTASDNSTLTYVWYFGDGNSKAGKVVSHAYGDNGIYNATLVVTDDNGYTSSGTIAVTVNNLPPTIEPVPDQTVSQDNQFTLKLNASDVPADVLTFSDNTTLFDIDPVTGIIRFTPTNADVGRHFVNVTVADDGGDSSAINFNITVLNVNDPPTLQPIPSQTATQDVPFTFQVDASDPDAGDVLTYSLTAYPTGMIITSAGLITWMPTNSDVGSHAVTVRVEDDTGVFDESTFVISVANINDAPMITTASLSNATESSMYMVVIQAEDIDRNELTFSFDFAPRFLSIDSRTGLIYGMPTESEVGAHQIILNVSDGTTFVTKVFNLTVINVNDLPVITSYPITVAKPGIEYAYTVIAEDADVGDFLVYSLIEGPEGMMIDAQTGIIMWTPTDSQAGQTFQVVVQVSDGQGTTAQTFSVTVDDLPVEQYRPLFDDYVWTGIVLLLITMIVIMSLASRWGKE
ncbi:MAG: PKD domain-containing protein [Candidatus Thermoplasmatota archaeon]